MTFTDLALELCLFKCFYCLTLFCFVGAERFGVGGGGQNMANSQENVMSVNIMGIVRDKKD